MKPCLICRQPGAFLFGAPFRWKGHASALPVVGACGDHREEVRERWAAAYAALDAGKPIPAPPKDTGQGSLL